MHDENAMCIKAQTKYSHEINFVWQKERNMEPVCEMIYFCSTTGEKKEKCFPTLMAFISLTPRADPGREWLPPSTVVHPRDRRDSVDRHLALWLDLHRLGGMVRDGRRRRTRSDAAA